MPPTRVSRPVECTAHTTWYGASETARSSSSFKFHECSPLRLSSSIHRARRATNANSLSMAESRKFRKGPATRYISAFRLYVRRRWQTASAGSKSSGATWDEFSTGRPAAKEGVSKVRPDGLLTCDGNQRLLLGITYLQYQFSSQQLHHSHSLAFSRVQTAFNAEIIRITRSWMSSSSE